MKANHNKGTHKHSHEVGMKSDGYRGMNGRLKSSSNRMSRPDITLSTGKGRHSVANATIKNQA